MRIAAVTGSLAAWLVYDAFVFILTAFAVLDSGRKVPRGEWEFVAAVAAVPLVLVALTVAVRIRRRRWAPASRFGWLIVAVQALGIAGLATALAVPTVVLWSYFNPKASIRMDNRSQYTYFLSVDGDPCGDNGSIEHNSASTIEFSFNPGEFGGCHWYKPKEIQFLSAFGRWSCAWTDAKSHEPLVITDNGPNCTSASYTPGILRQPTTTGGPPFSPPSH
jgi:hypothetical protein